MENKVENSLSCWQGRVLSSGGRTVLINSSLSSIPLYMMSFYELPVGVHKRIDYYRARMLWNEQEGAKKISFGGVEEGLSVKGAGGFRDFGFGWHE